MEFTKNENGAWLDKSILANGDKAKLVTEAVEVDSQNGKQIVAKVRIKMLSGKVSEPQNMSINNPTKNALIDAFGSDSKDWMNKTLTVHVESGIFAGKRGIMLCLVPEGFEVIEDSSGFVVIKRKGELKSVPAIEYPKTEIRPEDIPFD